MSRLVRELFLMCNNIECGHTYAAQLVVVRTLSPSAAPRADVHLPVVPRPDFRRRRPAAANDDRSPMGDVAQG